MIKMLLWCAAIVLVFTSAANAQTATPTSTVAWDEVGMAVATAQAATYSYYLDGASTATLTGTVTCVAGTASGTATCSAALPAMTAGSHTLTVSQTISGAESQKSNVLSFTFVVVITPANVRLR